MNIADMKLTIAGLQEGLEIEREENLRLREGLKLARDWLQGWASAEPYLTRIDLLLKDATGPQAPIAKVVVGEDDSLLTMLYAPGLPPGEHDLYCEPASVAPYLPGNS